VKNSFLLLVFSLLTVAVFGQEDDFTPQFSVRGGIYTGQVLSLELTSSNPNASIHYTTDGKTPTSGSRRYSSPIQLDGIHIIRAKAYVNGKGSDIVTNSYFMDREYTMPVVSLTTDTANLWSYSRGIYVKGGGATPNYPFRGANYWQNWERRANIEYYAPDNELGFNQGVGIKIFGGWSRPLPQKSLAIFPRKEYGKKSIKYKLFPDKDLDKFKSILLRNSGSDFNKTQFRDAFMTSLIRDLDVEIQAYQPAVLYINGKYWGVQNVREKINEDYLRYNRGVNRDSVDLIKHRSDVKSGSRKHYTAMLAYMRKNNLADQAVFDSVAQLMEVANYADYNIAETYYDNHDAGGNIRFWRPQTPGGKWRWVLFDTDFGFGIGNWKAYKTNTVEMFTTGSGPKWPNPPWSTFIIRKLLENEEYKKEYINRWADRLNTTFHPDTVDKQIDHFYALYKDEMPFHFERWGGNMARWEKSIQVLRDFARLRPTYCRKHLMGKFNFADTAQVNIAINAMERGSVYLNTLHLQKASFSGMYFVGLPVKLKAIPRFDYIFVKWEGLTTTEASIEVDPSELGKVRAVFEAKPHSELYQNVVFNEIAYSVVEQTANNDWLELYNASSAPIDLGGWLLKDSKDENTFTFPQGAQIASGNYLVVAQQVDSFVANYSDTIAAIGGFDFGFSSKGELLRLYDATGHLVDSLTYIGDAAGVNSLAHPDSAAARMWSPEMLPTPGGKNTPYLAFLKQQDEEAQQRLMLMIGGGVLLLLLVVGVVVVKRRKNAQKAA